MGATGSVIASEADARPGRANSLLIRYWPVLAICFAGALALLMGLGKASLQDWDEAIYAQISKEIIASGEWWTLHWGWRPYLRKPPVFMWTTALLYQLFGVSEFWARAASAFSGIGLLVVTYQIAKLIYDEWVGLFSSAILLTSYQFIASSRFGTTDIMLALFTYTALYAYLRLNEGSNKWWYVIWTFCALAVMTKSAAGVVAPATLTLALLLDRRLKQAIKSKEFWYGSLAALLLIAPWHVSMLVLHGDAFIDQYIGHSIVDRSTSVLDNHIGGRYYYIERLQTYFFPWVYLAPFALALSLKEMIQGRLKVRILMILLVLVFGICLVVQTKLRWYIVPLYPGLAILISSMALKALRDHTSAAFSGLVMAVFVVVLLAPRNIVLGFGCAGIAVMIVSLARRRYYYRPAAIAMCAFLIIAGAYTLRPLYQAGETPIARVARIAGSADGQRRTPLIIFADISKPTPLFYSDRPILPAYTLEGLARITKDQQPQEIILSEKDIEPISAIYDVHVLERADPVVYARIEPHGAR